jgi:hypothetical protein
MTGRLGSDYSCAPMGSELSSNMLLKAVEATRRQGTSVYDVIRSGAKYALVCRRVGKVTYEKHRLALSRSMKLPHVGSCIQVPLSDRTQREQLRQLAPYVAVLAVYDLDEWAGIPVLGDPDRRSRRERLHRAKSRRKTETDCDGPHPAKTHRIGDIRAGASSTWQSSLHAGLSDAEAYAEVLVGMDLGPVARQLPGVVIVRYPVDDGWLKVEQYEKGKKGFSVHWATTQSSWDAVKLAGALASSDSPAWVGYPGESPTKMQVGDLLQRTKDRAIDPSYVRFDDGPLSYQWRTTRNGHPQLSWMGPKLDWDAVLSLATSTAVQGVLERWADAVAAIVSKLDASPAA